MSDFEVEIEKKNYMVEPDNPSLSLIDSEDFDIFTEQLLNRANEGEDMTQIIAEAVMTLFHPGFVVIGSPNMESTEDGTLVPDSVAISLSVRNTLTPSNLAILLNRLGQSIIDDTNKEMEKLNDSN